MNLQATNGSGDTHGTLNGSGNLIIGHNADDTVNDEAETRTGSHSFSVEISTDLV